MTEKSLGNRGTLWHFAERIIYIFGGGIVQFYRRAYENNSRRISDNTTVNHSQIYRSHAKFPPQPLPVSSVKSDEIAKCPTFVCAAFIKKLPIKVIEKFFSARVKLEWRCTRSTTLDKKIIVNGNRALDSCVFSPRGRDAYTRHIRILRAVHR